MEIHDEHAHRIVSVTKDVECPTPKTGLIYLAAALAAYLLWEWR